MAEESYGIKETKEVLDLGFAIGKAVKDAKENDGKIDLADLSLLFGILPTIQPALDDISKIPSEFKDLSDEEGAELIAYVGQKIGGLTDKEKLVEQIDAGLKAGIAVYAFIKTF